MIAALKNRLNRIGIRQILSNNAMHNDIKIDSSPRMFLNTGMKLIATLFLLFFSMSEASKATQELLVAQQVARNFIHKHSAQKQKWGWESGVFLYGLTELIDASGDDSEEKKAFQSYVAAYLDKFEKKGLPAINRSDSCPPALTASYFVKFNPASKKLTEEVLHYLKHEPKNSIGTIDHLGHSFLRIFYPNSVWVDSLMMVGVTAAELGILHQDSSLIDFAAKQHSIFASVLQDQETNLFYHAWKERNGKVIPKTHSYWLRGNGWVLASAIEILKRIPANHPERDGIIKVLKSTSEAILKYQLNTGLWKTVLNLPEKSYEESSGTALVAYAYSEGFQMGLLDARYMNAAKLAWQGLEKKLKPTRFGLSLTANSAPTNPGPRVNYFSIRKINDAPYGVGPFLKLALSLHRHSVSNRTPNM